MPEGNLSIGATVDKGAFDEGMAHLGDASKATAAQMGATFQELSGRSKAAFAHISDDVKAAATSVSQESLRMAEATKGQAAALADLRRANMLTRDSNISAADSTALLAAAQDRAREASEALAASQETLGGELSGSESSLRTMNAEVRSLQGSLYGDTRAASEFLALLPGVGAAMEVAFPVFGAMALIGVLGMAAGKVKELIEDFKNLNATAGDADVARMMAGDKMQHIKAGNGLGDEFARRVEGLPSNPDSIDVKNANAVMRQVEYERQLADAQADVHEQGLTGIALEKQKIADIQKQIDLTEHAKAQAQDLADSYAKQLRATTTITHVNPIWGNVTEQITGKTISDPKQREGLTAQGNSAISAVERFQHEAELLQVKLQGAKLKLPTMHDKKATGRGAHDNTMALAEADLAELEQSHRLSVEEELAFWRKKQAATHTGGAAWLAMNRRIGALAQHELQHEAAERAKSEAVLYKAQQGGSQSLARTHTQVHVTNLIEYNQQLDVSAKVAEKNANALAAAQIEYARADMRISQYKEATLMAALHTKAYNEELARLRQHLADIETGDYGKSLSPFEKQRQGQDTSNQIQMVQGQQQVTALKDASAEAKGFAAPWQSSFNTINQSFLETQSKMIMGTTNIGLMFRNMGAQMVASTVTSLEQMALKWAEHELLTLLLHTQTEQAKTAITGESVLQRQIVEDAHFIWQIAKDIASLVMHGTTQQAKVAGQAAASVETQSIRTAANILAVTSNAAVGGSAVAAEYATLGPGPSLAAGMAAFAAIEGTFAGLAAFETGGLIPNTGVAMVHQGEAVLPRVLTEFMMGAATARQSGNTSSSTTHVTQNVHLHGLNDGEFKAAALRNAGTMFAAVKSHARRTGAVHAG